MTSETLRLVRMITWLPVGGIERRLVAVLPRLAARGWETRLICLREEGALAGELRAAGIAVEVLPLASRLDPRGLARLTQRLRGLSPDVVHTHMYRSNVPGTIAAALAGVPVIFGQVHNVGTWESWRQRTLDRWLARRRMGTIAVSRAVQEDVMRALGLPAERVPLLHNGVNTDRFRPDPEARASARAEMGVEEGELVLLVPARLHRNKRPLEILDAFWAEAHAHPAARATLVLAGDGPERPQVESWLRDHPGAPVRLLGQRDDMARLYNGADVVVQSSIKEGFSNAIIESLACGVPVVASTVGGNAEALETDSSSAGSNHGRDARATLKGRPGATPVGWLHDADAPEGLRENLREVLSSPERLRALRPACRERGLLFSLDRLVEETDHLYRTALEQARRERKSR